MDNLIRVEGHKNLFRDEESGAIINYDTNEYQKYMSMKSEKRKQKLEIEELKFSTSELKQELTEIKQLLRDLINGTK